jgi:biotin carboxyl carrier protein
VIFEATLDGRTVPVEVIRRGAGYVVTVDGRALEVDLHDAGRGLLSLIVAGRSHEAAVESRPGGYRITLDGGAVDVQIVHASRGAAVPRRGGGGAARVTAPMPGKLLRVLVREGEEVGAGQGLVVMEAMKMENELRAERAGRVREVKVAERQAVETGALLVVLE